MLKVVGASWLQTRISTYILAAVALLGIGAIILGEFGHVEQDGTYSATVSWNRKGGYRIDFWGQGNDLTAVPLNAARAYYKTGIFESGWSMIEIETSSKYPDTVQAYAAGLLEGSLTWQLIHHHWYNTVNTVCEKRAAECRKLMELLRENTAIIRERAEVLESADPFWHMVRLFYAQLDGLEAGWKFAVRRSRQSVEMETEDFLWLAMASDLQSFERALNISDLQLHSKGMIFLKALSREELDPLIAIGHNTAAPYTRMLRLLKKYTFNYHVLPLSKSTAHVPSRTIVMSSYPGALSSHDEFYLVQGDEHEFIVAGTPLSTSNHSLWNSFDLNNEVLSSVGLMAANRLAADGRSWSQVISFQRSRTAAMQWITFEPRTTAVWLIEQLPGITHAIDYTQQFKEDSFVSCNGAPNLHDIQKILRYSKEDDALRKNSVMKLQQNVTTLEHFRLLMRNDSQEDTTANQNLQADKTQDQQKSRDDLNKVPLPFGIIDTKILVADVGGIETFEATSGPITPKNGKPFKWSESFPNVSHIGHPDTFDFSNVTPFWVWV